jgi:hypothetical protein
MGFRPEPTHYHLRFADPAFKGLEVEIQRMNIGESLEFDKARLTQATTVEESEKKALTIAGMVAAKLVAWNLEDQTGQPVPTTLDGVLSQDDTVINPIIEAWVDAIRGVTPPLDGSSTSGDLSLEASMPMAALSPSLSS